jgi:phage protein D
MTNTTVNISQFFIRVNGQDLATTSMDRLIDAVVEEDLSQPGMFSIRFHDPNFELIDGSVFVLGAEVELGALVVGASGSQGTVIMKGEVTAIEPELEQYSTMLVVRGYDKSHRLYRGRKTRAFVDKKDSDIASTIAQEAGLSADVTATTIQHKYVMQDNKTNMEFLRDRAALIGYRVYAADGKLHFKTGEESPPAAPNLAWGEDLISFQARLSAVAQANEVEVRAWDPSSKQAIVGTASTPGNPHAIGFGKTGGAAAQTAFSGAAKVSVTNRPVATQGEATKLAQSVLDQLSGDFLSAEGVCIGNPNVRAGKTVTLSGIGTRFGGKYFITATRHVYTLRDGYLTTFIVSGRNPTNMVAPFTEPDVQRTVNGVVVGVVTSNQDDEGLGRIKVKFPWLDDQLASDWARISAAGAGPSRGFVVTPEVNDEVLVAFEHGDINRPYILGGLWNGKDKHGITDAVADGKVNVRTFKTRIGHTITFNDDDGAGKKLIEIKTAGGMYLTLGDGDKKIVLKSAKHTVTLDDNGTGKVTVESGGELELKGAQSVLKFTTGGNLELSNPGGKLTIGPAGVNLETNAMMTVKGANSTFEAQAMGTVKSAGILVVQGSLVKIN